MRKVLYLEKKITQDFYFFHVSGPLDNVCLSVPKLVQLALPGVRIKPDIVWHFDCVSGQNKRCLAFVRLFIFRKRANAVRGQRKRVECRSLAHSCNSKIGTKNRSACGWGYFISLDCTVPIQKCLSKHCKRSNLCEKKGRRICYCTICF